MPMLLVGGSILLWKRGRVLRSKLAATALVLCLLPLAARFVYSLESDEVRLLD